MPFSVYTRVVGGGGNTVWFMKLSRDKCKAAGKVLKIVICVKKEYCILLLPQKKEVNINGFE